MVKKSSFTDEKARIVLDIFFHEDKNHQKFDESNLEVVINLIQFKE